MPKRILNKVNFFEPVIGGREIENIKEVIKINWPNEGKFTKLFERKIEKKLKVKHAVCVTSGTISIFLSLKAIGVTSHDEVIVPDITFGATAMAVKLSGAKLVIADIDKESLSFDFQDLKKKINKKTKAIIPVHISGRGANMTLLKRLARKKRIYLVEDAAEALFSKYKNFFLGTIGDVGCFSLTASKIITTGQGGIIVTNNTKIYKKIKLLKNQGVLGQSDGGDVKHVTEGYNFKYTNLQAAMGLAQLDTLAKRASKLKKNNRLYRSKLKNIKDLKILNFNYSNGEVPLWTDVYVKENRNELISFLKKKGIICRKFWYPLHLQKPFKNSNTKVKASSKIYKKLFWLPSSINLTEKKINHICNLIIRFFNKKR